MSADETPAANSEESQATASESATYQAMLDEVEGIVRDVSSETIDLDAMVHKIERGYSLIKTMRLRLAETKAKVDKLRLEFE